MQYIGEGCSIPSQVVVGFLATHLLAENCRAGHTVCQMYDCVIKLFCMACCRMNSKLREKGKKDEGKRLREFVDAAYRLDPRVAARKELQAAER